MATLNIDTRLTEFQLKTVLAKVNHFLYSNRDNLNNTVFEYEIGDIRIEAEFDQIFDQIIIKEENRFMNGLNAEIFTDYLTLKSDTMVFQQRLQYLLDELNNGYTGFNSNDERQHYRDIAFQYAG